MRLSLIMPVLNEERIIGESLAHVLSLSFDEVIVVDGGSRDRTRKIVESFQKPRTSNLEPRIPNPFLLTTLPGRARQMNAGAAMAQGEGFLFLHADTRLPDDARQLIERAMTQSDCVGGRFNVRFEPQTGWGRVISTMMNWRSRWTGIATGDQAIFVRRTAFERLGGFADVPIMEDIDFTRRLKRLGHVTPLQATVVTSYRRWQHGGPLRTILLMWFLRGLYWAGIKPHTLTRLYANVR